MGNIFTTLAQSQEIANGVIAKVKAKNYLTAADIISYTLKKQAEADAGYSATYQMFTVGTGSGGADTPVGDKIQIAKDMVVKDGSVVDVTFDSETDKLFDGLVDVTAIIKGEDTPTAADAGKYIKLEIANATEDKLYIKATDLVDVYGSGNGITITNNTVSINIDNANKNGLGVTENGLKLDLVSASTSGEGGSAGAMSATDKEKLDNADVTPYTAGDGVQISGHSVGAKVVNANGLSVDSTGVKMATAASAVKTYVQASGTYVEGTKYYTDSTGAVEVDTTSFEQGVTDVSSYFVEEVTMATAGAMSGADKQKLDDIQVATAAQVTAAIAALDSL